MPRRYSAVALVVLFLAYAVLLVVSTGILSSGGISGGPLRALVALLPVPAALGIIAILMARFLATDELEQRIQLTAVALSFLGTLVLTFSWGFLEGVGFERLSGFTVFAVLVGLYVIGLVSARRRYR